MINNVNYLYPKKSNKMLIKEQQEAVNSHEYTCTVYFFKGQHTVLYINYKSLSIVILEEWICLENKLDPEA